MSLNPVALNGAEFTQFWTDPVAFYPDVQQWVFEDDVEIQINDLAQGADSYARVLEMHRQPLTETDVVTVFPCVLIYEGDRTLKNSRRNLAKLARSWKKRWDERLTVSLDIPAKTPLTSLIEALHQHNVPIPPALRQAAAQQCQEATA